MIASVMQPCSRAPRASLLRELAQFKWLLSELQAQEESLGMSKAKLHPGCFLARYSLACSKNHISQNSLQLGMAL